MQKVRCKECEEIINRSQQRVGGGEARRVMPPPPTPPYTDKKEKFPHIEGKFGWDRVQSHI